MDHFSGSRLDISGTKDFSMQAAVTDGTNEPFLSCGAGCIPGDKMTILVSSSGNDLPGTATLRGKTYADLGGLVSPNSAEIMISGEITIPPMAAEPTSVTVPFDFGGRLHYAPDDQTPQEVAYLTGGGRVTFQFEPSSDGSQWIGTTAKFEFVPVKR